MVVNKKKEMKVVDVSFDIVLIFKSLFALGGVIGGFLLFFLTPARLNSAISWLAKGEMNQSSHSFLMKLLLDFGAHFTVSTQYLFAIYLLSHGIIKLVTLVLLWKKVLWAYPLSLLVFLGFIIYQLTEFAHTHSVMMIVVSLVDVLMIVLTLLEYQNIKKQRKEKFCQR